MNFKMVRVKDLLQEGFLLTPGQFGAMLESPNMLAVPRVCYAVLFCPQRGCEYR